VPEETRKPTAEELLEELKRSQLAMLKELLPVTEKAVEEAGQSPEWTNSPKLAKIKQRLARNRILLEQNGQG
jgi:hypothetical protein